MTDQPTSVNALLAGRARAHRRALAVHGEPTSGDPVRDALELWDLNPALFDAPANPVRVREVERVRAMWRRLRAWHRGQR